MGDKWEVAFNTISIHRAYKIVHKLNAKTIEINMGQVAMQ